MTIIFGGGFRNSFMAKELFALSCSFIPELSAVACDSHYSVMLNDFLDQNLLAFAEQLYLYFSSEMTSHTGGLC